MTVGIRALVGAISREELVSELGCDVCVCLEEAMMSSHVEDVSVQDRGRDLGPPTWVGKTSLMMPFLALRYGLPS